MGDTGKEAYQIRVWYTPAEGNGVRAADHHLTVDARIPAGRCNKNLIIEARIIDHRSLTHSSAREKSCVISFASELARLDYEIEEIP